MIKRLQQIVLFVLVFAIAIALLVFAFWVILIGALIYIGGWVIQRLFFRDRPIIIDEKRPQVITVEAEVHEPIDSSLPKPNAE